MNLEFEELRQIREGIRKLPFGKRFWLGPTKSVTREEAMKAIQLEMNRVRKNWKSA